MKRRIFLGLTPLFLLLIAMGGYAVSLFSRLGNSIDVILRENFVSVLAGQQMKETAERMDSALLLPLLGEEERGREMYAQNARSFGEALAREKQNITLPGEQELADRVERLHREYLQEAETFWRTSDPAARRTIYLGKMLPLFTQSKDTAQEILRVNEESMIAANAQAKAVAGQSTRYMLLAIAIGLAGAAFFAVRLQRAILMPIATLTSVARELGEGKLDQVVPVPSQDELGELADAFNKMATKLRAYRQVTSDQILQARQMTEITLSAFPDAIVALSSEGVVRFTNPAANKLLGKLGLAGSLPRSVKKESEAVLKGAPDYLPTSFEHSLVFRIDDREVFLLPRVVAMRDDAENIFGAAVILQDVTRFRLMDDVKNNLVSTVSHELKTPLTSVRMGLHLLLEERIGALNSKQTEILLAAREDSERLLRMINDMLDLAKLESGGTALPGQATNPRALVESVSPELSAQAESHGCRLIVELQPGLPEVSVDARRIAHVFSNFVSNALKHSKAGGEIILKAEAHGGSVRFSICDDGPGIPEAYRSRIFDRFFRIPGSASAGAGLGLAIAKEIVSAQGGQIGVQSKPGEGSQFYFDLPSLHSPSHI